MKTKISYGKCHIEVEGMDMVCPLCATVIRSGQTHDCDKRETEERKISKLPVCREKV